MTRPLPAKGLKPIPDSRLRIRDQRIPPTRGLMVAHTRDGRPLRVVDLQRWLRLCRHAFKTDKVDVVANGEAVAVLEDLLPSAAALDVRLSLRTDASIPPYRLETLKRLGLLDVCLCPNRFDIETLRPWLSACANLDVPVRVQLAIAQSSRTPGEIADDLAGAGVVRVDLALCDSLAREYEVTPEALESAGQLADMLESRDVEANLLNVPFCFVDESHWARVAGARQRAVDHAGYVPESRKLAERFFDGGPWVAGMIVRILLSNATLYRQPADNFLLPGLIRRHYLYLFARIYRRLSINLRLARGAPKPKPQSAYETALNESRQFDESRLPAPCSACALRRICDGVTPRVKAALPAVSPSSVAGDHVVSPLHFALRQPKYYDALDAARVEIEDSRGDLAAEALSIITNRPPDVQVGPHDYAVEDTHFDRMESGLKWWSVSNAERLSTPLGTFSLPLTISVDFGAGIADFVGFQLGRHCRLVCPMEGYRHNVTLHVSADGRYVLLRDRVPVRPSEFEGHYYLPTRLGEQLQPRISAWNIDECIATQNVRIWTGNAPAPAKTPKYSIIIVSTRFTRRLHAVLRSLAHQQGFDMNAAEIIINYVPGIDATDDLIDSVTMTYPNLHIVRNPFPERFMNSKGFLINEAAKIARGEWIMLLDSDTLLPPDYFAKIEAISGDAEFIAPDGRKLLPKDLTARILMGELEPWEHWDELIAGAGEFRHRETFGIPVGFCQTFRAKYLQMFPYLEVDHFETADMQFGGEMIKHLGEETRLSGTPVLHLDHGGSQWYGTQKHM